MTNNTLGPRPAPHQISFAPECFEQIGTETVYTVSQSALRSGPAVFTDKNEAEAFASKRGRKVSEHQRPVMRRVRWF